MQGWTSIYSHQRKQLARFQLSEGSEGSDPSIQYLYYSPLLLKLWFLWKTFVFLIDLYYVNECCLWIAFKSFYQYSLDQLLPLNIVLLIVLLGHLVLKAMMTPRLPPSMVQLLGLKSRWLLWGEHFLMYDNYWVNLIVFICFLLSYFVQYPAAGWLHLVYTLKLLDMNSYLAVVHTKIHIYKVLRVAYRLSMLMFIILYLSNIFAAAFYYIDQRLIDQQYFGAPQSNPAVYYQFNSQSYTPIEMFSEVERYIMAFYFSNGLVTTIAYGDIVGENYIEDIYVTILMVVSTVMVAFLLQQFMIMVEDNRFAIYDIVKDFRHLEQLMRQKGVPSSLQLRIRNYLLYIEYYDKFQNPALILAKLTKKMRNDLFRKGYGPQLAQLFTPLGLKNLNALCQHIQEVIYQPEVDLYLPQWKRNQGHSRQCACQSQTFNPSFLCLTKGRVSQYLQWQFESAKFQMREGLYYINAFQFLTQTQVRYGLRTKTIVQFIRITYNQLVEVLELDNSLRKQFRKQRERVLTNVGSRKLFNDDCQVCNGEDHSAIDCPEVHLTIDPTIPRGLRVDELLSSKVNNIKRRSRKQLVSKKVINVAHYSSLFANLSLGGFGQEFHLGYESLEVGVGYLHKTIKNLFEKARIEESRQGQGQQDLADCCYDPEGVEEEYRLEHS